MSEKNIHEYLKTIIKFYTYMDKTKVLIVNDSKLKRALLGDIIKSIPFTEVIDECPNGVIALMRISIKKPDVILLDLEMPQMDGITFLRKLMPQTPIPVIIVSSYAHNGSHLVLDAIEAGAVDYLEFPTDITNNFDKYKKQIASKIKTAINLDKKLLTSRKIPSLQDTQSAVHDSVIVIGASTGGPELVNRVISQLPSDVSAGVLVIQHMLPASVASFVEYLKRNSKLEVRIAKEGDVVKRGVVLVAPGDHHMKVTPEKTITLTKEEKIFGVRPAISPTMISASEAYGARSVGVILTGMGHDGGFGCLAIKKRGGITIVQDESSSVVFGMGKEARDLNAVDIFVPPDLIVSQIISSLQKIGNLAEKKSSRSWWFKKPELITN